MGEAVICPVCNGKGRTHFYDSTGTLGEECHSCSGRGWVEVSAPPIRPDKYIAFQRKVTLICPDCGADKHSRPETGCKPGSHYGTHSVV